MVEIFLNYQKLKSIILNNKICIAKQRVLYFTHFLYHFTVLSIELLYVSPNVALQNEEDGTVTSKSLTTNIQKSKMDFYKKCKFMLGFLIHQHLLIKVLTL